MEGIITTLLIHMKLFVSLRRVGAHAEAEQSDRAPRRMLGTSASTVI